VILHSLSSYLILGALSISDNVPKIVFWCQNIGMKGFLAKGDRAENSIMQTITIAVSIILVAAGLLTAPGLINNARDNNAKGDLAIIAYAQEWALSNTYLYYENIEKGQPDSLYDKVYGVELSTGIKYSLSGGTTNRAALVCNIGEDSTSAYLLRAESTSGKVFYRASKSAEISENPADLDIDVCILSRDDYDDFIL